MDEDKSNLDHITDKVYLLYQNCTSSMTWLSSTESKLYNILYDACDYQL